MNEHEIWLTRFFNDYLAGLGNLLLSLFHQAAPKDGRPWANFIVMQILVAAHHRDFVCARQTQTFGR